MAAIVDRAAGAQLLLVSQVDDQSPRPNCGEYIIWGCGARRITGTHGNGGNFGGSGPDQLDSGAGHGLINGGNGYERLIGGDGYDTSVFSTALELAGNFDTSPRFNTRFEDRIAPGPTLLAAISADTPALDASAFRTNRRGTAMRRTTSSCSTSPRAIGSTTHTGMARGQRCCLPS